MKLYHFLLLHLVFLFSTCNCVTADNTELGSIIGIDIGNTFSSVGVYRNGKVEIIENEYGQKLIPSKLTFNKNGNITIGENVNSQNLTNSVIDLKYLLGKSHDDKVVKEDLRKWPFKVTNRDDQLAIKITLDSGIKLFTPEEITSYLLSHLKTMAETHLKEKVYNCIITHPVYFDNSQRLALKDAAKLAGLNVIRMIKEPIAAAQAFGLDKKGNNRNILVYHLGGSTLDVTLLSYEDGVFEVVANRGSASFGGANFNQRVVDHLRKEFETKSNQVLDPEEIKTLQQNVEKAKITLSTQNQTAIQIKKGVVEILTRKKFEELNLDLFEDTLSYISKILDDSFLNKSDIYDIILIGGSTRIPIIKELVEDIFNGKEDIIFGVEPDLAVVTGAAMTAGKIQNAEKTMFESAVEWIVSKLVWSGSSIHDELK